MSLAISIGVLACGDDADPEAVAYDRKNFKIINKLLAKQGLPPHHELEELPKFPYRGQLISFPYSWLHYLRRAVAYARQSAQEFCPLRKGEKPGDDKRLNDEHYTFISSHVCCHSDCEGYYVPIDFHDPLFDTRKKGGLPGGILGSSQQALQELVKTAPLLGIKLKGEHLSDKAAKEIAKEADEAHPYWIERKVWLSLFEAFRQSVEYKCAVVFG